jgi:hypothetical protein
MTIEGYDEQVYEGLERVTTLAIPWYIGEPLRPTCTCPECGDTVKAEIRFVATGYVGDRLTLDSARGVWEPAIYVCPAGHYTMESEI